MTAYNESNFNSCLEAISEIRDQRNEAIRIAHRLEEYIGQIDHSFQPKNGCDCAACGLGKQLSDLKLKVIAYQNKAQKK